MTDSGWLHYRDLKSRCPVCKRPAHIAKRNGNFYFVDDEYNPFVRHAPVNWEKGVYLGDVLDFFDRHGETLIEKRAGSWHGDSTEVAKASECLQKGLAQFGLTLAQARERYGKREKARYRKWAETVAFFATDCSFLDIANLVDRSVAQVVHEIHDTWYEDYMLGCIDYIASVAYHGGILLKPITTEKEITGHIGDTILSWCEKGQKDDGGNEFRD